MNSPFWAKDNIDNIFDKMFPRSPSKNDRITMYRHGIARFVYQHEVKAWRAAGWKTINDVRKLKEKRLRRCV